MKKLLLIVLCTLFIVSCSNKKTVIISGKIAGGNPLERIEIVEMSGVATLPIANFGVDAQGNFSDTIQIPKNGVYTLSYGGNYGVVYLKGGENIRLSGNAGGFPREFTVEGDSKNNVFLQKTKSYVDNYFSKINQDIITQDEPKFLGQLKKFKSDLNKEMDNLAKSTGADNDLVKWKKEELNVNLLGISGQYAIMHGQITNKPNFKVTQAYKDFQKELTGNEDEKIKNFPLYREFLINTIGQDFQAYAMKNQKPNVTTTEQFINYVKDKKEYSQLVKDYLVSFVSRIDMNPQQPNSDKLIKVLDENIKDSDVKAGVKKIEEAIYGLKIGASAPSVDFIDVNGKKVASSSFNGKPTLIMFYASWNPYMAESVVPMVKELTNTYKSKMNIAYVSMDDNTAAFKKSAVALLTGLDGQKLYAKGGLKSDAAQKFALYGFKLPSFLILDKDGKVASRTFMNIMDPEFKTAMDKISGITGPAIVLPQMQMQPTPAPAPADSTKVKTEAKAK
ncbi:redoxin domain-containing protein [Elizabethkingia meningoseptica]|uniref:TlpA family protein disulfide reductase n=1 Tax=Elizabethkingia meningoseptica TaxID=238 RepID=UPI0023B0ACAA|nr:redoxin family protein [Elizabethkingia meningoseptica]MDE5439300.1 redoxin domain-containing protein [Elizabethkingia meningoseptica]MDE5510060.1 redoxin domain-containing protein [Elizabethkingia meningoseptica]MDE5517036.1 redoxin domain-containing protein [Elizabethkingia meningoseptica]MDE5527641.1 redoxin domain-containing protein [Elizabethkingia meningoseptica]MDE5531276.1 redoxin domain-containing protein [Elizabethkingia meningoseptica]